MKKTWLLSAALVALATQAQTTGQTPTQAPAQTGATAPVDTRTTNLWSRLWRTADQRGQALLRQGDAAGAAREFIDPEHKAHAALQAGDYTGAAQTLTGVDTAEAHYNRGNALAHSGDLQGAIKAYDAALKQNPQHTDARHNRDIVAAALQKQKQQDDKKDGNKKDSDKSGNDKKDGSKDDGKSDAKSGDQKDDKSGSKPGESQADKSAGKPGDKAGEKPDDKPNDKPGQKPDNQTATKPGERPASTPQSDKASAAPTTAASATKDDPAQARRDAESALGKGSQLPQAAQRGASGPNLAADSRPPVTEKQIAQEQWLRSIPDDPGGLLRRKFLIEHMLRQQGQKP